MSLRCVESRAVSDEHHCWAGLREGSAAPLSGGHAVTPNLPLLPHQRSQSWVMPRRTAAHAEGCMHGVEGKESVKGGEGPGKVLPALLGGTDAADPAPRARCLLEPLLSTLPLCLGHQRLLCKPLAFQLQFLPPHPQPTHSVPAARVSTPFYSFIYF